MEIHRRFRTPTSNPNVNGRNYWAGWCHSHVRIGFGLPSVYSTAMEAWEKAERRHKDRKFPKADVPLFFSLRGVPAGHIVVRLANGKVQTSGLNSTVKTFSSLEALLRAWPSLTYLGWTEDLNKYDIITGFGEEDNILGVLMSEKYTRKNLRADLADILDNHGAHGKMLSARKDAKGKAIQSNVGTEVRRNTIIGDQTRKTVTQIEGSVAALGKAIEQLSGGKIDMAAIEKAAFEGAEKALAEADRLDAAELADMLEISVRDIEP